jgi:hypothetical protein
MASNGKPQLLRSIFSQQSNGAAGDAGGRFGRQDKGRTKAARPHLSQPAPRVTGYRPNQTNRKPPRSQKPLAHNQKTVHLTLWVNPIVKEELQRIATRDGLTVSKVGSAFLAKAIQTNLDLQYGAILQPVIESAIRKEMAAIRSRLAWLLVRVAFDTGQTRALVTNILGRHQGVTEDLLKNILSMSQRTAKGSLTRKSPQLSALIDAVEHWLNDTAP